MDYAKSLKNFSKKYYSLFMFVNARDWRGLKTAISRQITNIAAEIGAEVVKKSYGYYTISIYMKKDGKYMYVNFDAMNYNYDSRKNLNDAVFLYRLCKDENDCIGSFNNFATIFDLKNDIARRFKFDK